LTDDRVPAPESTSGARGRTTIGESFSPEGRRDSSLTILCALVFPICYLIFVIHYGKNVPQGDDWNVVPLIGSAIEGHLSWSDLWALHNQNRMLFPNLTFVTLGAATRDNLVVFMVLGATLFIATYFAFLHLWRSYVGTLTPLATLVVGAVWFSLIDWGNALWGFQFAWYLILACLIATIWVLSDSATPTAFGLGAGLAILASLSSLQGLLLWPIGLAVLAWRLPVRPQLWTRGTRIKIALWVAFALVTSVVYFWNYSAGPVEKSSVGIKFEFFLVELGELIPNTNERLFWASAILGGIVLICAVYVVVRSIQQRHVRSCLPATLIAFGLTFDILVALGRSKVLGITLATASDSRYTMVNILVLLAILAYGWVHIEGKTMFVAVGLLLLALQAIVGSVSGIENASQLDRRLTTSARLVVNLDSIPASKESCYALHGVSAFVYPTFGLYLRFPAFSVDQKERLNIFSPGIVRGYRAEGLPDIPQCGS
jgi:hypothetical protein